MASATTTNAIQTPSQWAHAIAAAAGWPQTPSNITFLTYWAQAEGGNFDNTAAYNVLNTSQPATGSVNYQSGTSGGGVQSYTSWNEGINATIYNLQNGFSGNPQAYNPIVSALQQGNASQAFLSGSLTSSLNTWDPDGNDVAQLNKFYGGSAPADIDASGNKGGTNTGSNAPTTLMGDCHSYGLSKYGSSSCIFSIPLGPCFTTCEAKAVISGGALVSGAVLMLVGTALLFKGGLLGTLAKAGVSAVPGGATVLNLTGGQFARSRETRQAPATVRTSAAGPDEQGERENRAYMEGFFKASKPNHKPEGSRLNTNPAKGARYADTEGEF